MEAPQPNPHTVESQDTTYREFSLNQDAAEALAAFGNHEAKALTILYFWHEGTFLSKYQTKRGFTALQGDDPGWVQNPGSTFQYCKHAFEPMGYVVEGEVETRKGPTVGYGLSQRGIEEGVPAAGLILDWSLRYPDISVQQIFGGTSSSGGSRAPDHNFQVLSAVINDPEGELKIAATDVAHLERSSMPQHQYIRRLNNTRKAIDRLEACGVVACQSATEVNTRRFDIIDPDYPVPGTHRGIFTETMYSYLRECFTSGNTIFTYEEAFEFVSEQILLQYPDADLAVVRRRLNQILSSEEKLPGVRRLGSFNNGKLTIVSLNNDLREPVGDLLSVIKAIEQRDPEYIEKGYHRADQIINNPDSVATLMAKAYRFSPHARNIDWTQSSARLRVILQDSPRPLTLEEVTTHLNDVTGSRFSATTVGAMLRRLRYEGDVTVTKTRKREADRNAINLYKA